MTVDDHIIEPEEIEPEFPPFDPTAADGDLPLLDDSELWELLPDSVPAPFIAGSYSAEALQANLAVVGSVTADDMQANLSAVVLARSDWFESIGSAVALASVEGDAEINTSAVPLLIAKGDIDFHQAYASAVVAGGTVHVHQGGSPFMLAKQLKIEQGAGAVLVAGEATVERSFVGIVLARNANVSQDSRVLLDGRSAAIVAAGLLGGLGLLALAVMRGFEKSRTDSRAHSWYRRS